MKWTPEKIKYAESVLVRHKDMGRAMAEIWNQLGDDFSSGAMRRAFGRAGRVSPHQFLGRNVEPVQIGDIPKSIPVPGSVLSVEYGRRANDSYLRGLERQVGRREYLGDRIEIAIKKAFQAQPVSLNKCQVKSRTSPGNRLITALVSDVHFGINVDPREVPGGGYNWLIASRRMARLASEIASWKEHHREQTDLHVAIAGDLLAGVIHLDDAGIRKITEQIHGATLILVPFFDYLKQHFAKVSVSCLPGNHDRVTRERQIANRWDSHAHSVYLGLAMAFRNDKSISFDIPLTGDCTVELPGGKSLAFYTHGDVRPTVANVGKSLDLKPMIANLNRINASGEFKKPVRILAMGHYHSPFVAPAGAGTILINGCCIGPDAFARNGCGVMGDEGAPMQVIFESVPGYEFGDSRFIRLREADHDSAYDKIIKAPSLDVWSVAA